jgi:arylsulfatase A-like enzyme
MHYPHAPHRSDYFTCYRRGDWKVIYHYYPSKGSEDSRYQLYNLRDDPFEQNNLAATKSDRLSVMMQSLIASMEQHNALYPVDKADGMTPLKPKLP